MNQGNQNKSLTFANGWVKTSKQGTEYISISSNPEKSYPQGIKLFAELPDGRTVALTNFQLYWNAEKRSENSPDVRLSFFDEPTN